MEKQHIMYMGTHIRLSADFLAETLLQQTGPK